MARIVNSHLGIPIGKMGDIVFKRRNKKIFSQFAAEKYKETTSERVIKNRSLFGEVMVFSNFINRSPVIKYIWRKRKDMPGKATNMRIFKQNHPHIKSKGISSRCRILPYNLQIYEAAIGLTVDSLTFSFKNSYKGVVPESYSDFKPPFLFIAIIHMEEPVNEKVKHKMMNIKLEEMLLSGELSDSGFTHFTFNTAKKTFKIIKDYNKIIVYPAVISFDEYKQPYKWAECGGLYVKGADRVNDPPPKPDPVQEAGVSIEIECR